jgi:hypothetical protein
MGTRGLFGFYYKGKYYLIYNHFDSYKEYLGKNLVNEIKAAIENETLSSWISMLENIIVINENVPKPNENDMVEIITYYSLENIPVDSQKIYQMKHDWYSILYPCQGSFIRVLRSGYLLNEDATDQLTGDIFIEHSYIINFDTNEFHYYKHNGKHKIYNLNSLPKW